MSATQQNYSPAFEIAVLESLGEAGIQGKRDVIIKVESGKYDLNEDIKTITIPEINDVSLSLKMNGFDTYKDNSDLGIKTISGNIYIVAKKNGQETEEFKVHAPIVPIHPINAKDNSFPPILEAKKDIESAWYTAFGEALSDIIDQTTVITGNHTAYNPYTLDNTETTSMANPKRQKITKESKGFKLPYWGVVGLIAVAMFILAIGVFKFINKSSSEQQSLQQGSSIQQVPYDESQDVNNQGSFAPVPQQLSNESPSQQNSEQQIEAEVLDEFGLESNVNLN